MSPVCVSGCRARPVRPHVTWYVIVLSFCLAAVAGPAARGATYASGVTAYDFIDTATHTRITAWPGCSDQAGDDSLSAPISIGFPFNFGGVDHAQVRVHTNGRLQFNNTACGFGTQSVGPPRTYPSPLPDATMNSVMRVYGADLDLNAGGFITFATVGTAPNRRFVVTWNQVGAWQEGGKNNVGAGASYTLQIQLFEGGEFRYMYGDSDNISEPSNTNMGPGQIGWQLSTTDFQVVQSGLPANRSGIRFYIETPMAEYRFEQARLTGATGEVLDSSGNGQHGTRIDSPANVPVVDSVTGRVCRGINVPSSPTALNIDAIDTGLPVQRIGHAGTITFWYRSALNWTATDNVLFDASTTSGRWFSFGKTSLGRLRFTLTDDASSPVTVDLAPSTSNNFTAGTWTHLAVTWRVEAGSSKTVLRIYLNGQLYGSGTATTNGTLHRSLSTLYIGDTRLGGTSFAKTVNAAGGVLDEFRVYDYDATQAVIQRDMAVTRPCGGLDHFSIAHAGSAVTCEAATVQLSAHSADHDTVADYASVVALNTSTGSGDWALLSGAGSFDNGSANDGRASYRFVATDGGAVSFTLRHTVAGVVNLDVSDGSASERSGTATPADDRDLSVKDAGFVFTANGVDGAIGTQIAGKASALAPGLQSLALRAIRTSEGTGACEAALVGTQVVQFAYECVSPAACSGRRLAIDGGSATSIAGNGAAGVTAYTPVTLAFDATGAAPFVTTFDDAGSVRLHARFELPLADGGGSGDFMQGSSNVFAWRPFALEVTVPGNPAASNASGPRFLAAGASFDASVRAVLWSAADDTNADGIADGMTNGDTNPANNARLSDNSTAPNFAPTAPFSLGAALVQPVGGHHPGLAGSPSATLAAGIATVSGLRYDETGIIELSAVQTGNYLGIGSAATAAIRGLSGTVGRFHPARFAVSANTPSFADACAAGHFTYMDQPFPFDTAPVLTVTALNTGGDTTQNYTTPGFFRFDSTLADRSASDRAARPLMLTAGAGATAAGTTQGTGAFTLSLPADATGDRFTYTRSAPVAPFAASVDLTVPAAALSDRDSVCHDPDGDGSCDSFRVPDITGSTQRFGRLATDNVLGSELLPLATPVRAEYYTGAGFVRNDADVCTAIPVTALDLGSGSADEAPAMGETRIPVGSGNATATIAHAPLAGGLLGLAFSAPGAGNVGEFDYRIDLGVAASTWLRYDWNGDGTLGEDPRGRASFGLYAGPRSIVYQRDLWR